jgi:hypothetical protein
VTDEANPSARDITQFLEIYKVFRDYEKHENELLNHRTSWLVTIQSVLIATFGFSFQKFFEVATRADGSTHGRALIVDFKWFLVSLAGVGILIAVWSWISIYTAIRAQRAIRKVYRRNFSAEETQFGLPHISGGGDTFASWFGGYLAVFLPWLLIVLWGAILVYWILLYPVGDTI